LGLNEEQVGDAFRSTGQRRDRLVAVLEGDRAAAEQGLVDAAKAESVEHAGGAVERREELRSRRIDPSWRSTGRSAARSSTATRLSMEVVTRQHGTAHSNDAWM
jgi:hypothetical protein